MEFSRPLAACKLAFLGQKSAPVSLTSGGRLDRYMCDLMENKSAQGWAVVGALGVVYTVIASLLALVSYDIVSTIPMGDMIVFIYLFSVWLHWVLVVECGFSVVAREI